MNLPEFRAKVNETRDELAENQHFLSIQEFTKILNNDVDNDKLQKHPNANAWYLPISHVELMLDEAFFGLWQTTNFKWDRIQNEICASIELSVFHPIQKIWITRTGSAAKKIMTDAAPDNLSTKEKNEWHLNLSNKKPSALDDLGGFAALKADAFKNAAISIGRVFGRDVNREHTGQFEPVAKDKSKNIEKIRTEIGKWLEALPDSRSQEIIDGLVEKEQYSNLSEKYYKQILHDVKADVYTYFEQAKKNMSEEEFVKYDTDQKVINLLKNINNGGE